MHTVFSNLKTCTGICSTLLNPLNGMVEMNNNTVGSIATYSCFTNYILIGPEERNCTADIGWSGEDPLCCKFAGNLIIQVHNNFPLFHDYSEDLW